MHYLYYVCDHCDKIINDFVIEKVAKQYNPQDEFPLFDVEFIFIWDDL